MKTGEPLKAIAEGEKVIEGEVRIGGQEHFYLETHACIVIPGEGEELEVICGTQNVNDIQVHTVFHVCD